MGDKGAPNNCNADNLRGSCRELVGNWTGRAVQSVCELASSRIALHNVFYLVLLGPNWIDPITIVSEWDFNSPSSFFLIRRIIGLPHGASTIHGLHTYIVGSSNSWY